MAPDRHFALITGASSGIGAVYAERLAAAGRALILVARRKDRLTALAEKLSREGGVPVEVLQADLADAKQLHGVEQRIERGDVDLLVNNAGIGGYGPFVDLPLETIDRLMDLHIRATARLTRFALPAMVARKSGAVINVASLLSLSGTLPPNPMPYRATYAAAKAFMLTFSQALAGELLGTGVSVQICLPGLVETEFHGSASAQFAGRTMAAQDVVHASLTALARGESVCIPGLEEAVAFDRIGEAQRTVLGAANRPKLADRYR